ETRPRSSAAAWRATPTSCAASPSSQTHRVNSTTSDFGRRNEIPDSPSAAFCHSVAASAKQTAARRARVAANPFTALSRSPTVGSRVGSDRPSRLARSVRTSENRRLHEVEVKAIDVARLEPLIGAERMARFERIAQVARETLAGASVLNVNSTGAG